MERLTKIGAITPKKSMDIKKSRIGLGFEKLDRDVFDPDKAYAFVAESGAKWARLQSGWQRTEKEKGVYDFRWLDKVVDNMLAIGVEPWLCLCYGNEIYSQEAKTVFGAVGIPPIHTQEEKEGWANYVRTLVEHYKGRIHYYEVWNEPDSWYTWRCDPNPVDLAEFTKATAIVCKEADPSCEVIGLSLCYDLDFAASFIRTDVLDYIDGITFHTYSVEENEWIRRLTVLRDLIHEQGKDHIKIFQGESGGQSRGDGDGAMKGGAWSELKQAKFLLRHLVTDLGYGVEFASYFSCLDMMEALNGTVGDASTYMDFAYFGVLGADFDENGRSCGTYTPKPSYYALQNFCSALAEDYTVCDVPVQGVVLDSVRLQGKDFDFANARQYCFKRENGSRALFYWSDHHILAETYEGTTSLKLDEALLGEKILLTDLLTGAVYQLTDAMVEEQGILKNIPILDSPLMLTFGDFFDWE